MASERDCWGGQDFKGVSLHEKLRQIGCEQGNILLSCANKTGKSPEESLEEFLGNAECLVTSIMEVHGEEAALSYLGGAVCGFRIEGEVDEDTFTAYMESLCRAAGQAADA